MDGKRDHFNGNKSKEDWYDFLFIDNNHKAECSSSNAFLPGECGTPAFYQTKVWVNLVCAIDGKIKHRCLIKRGKRNAVFMSSTCCLVQSWNTLDL